MRQVGRGSTQHNRHFRLAADGGLDMAPFRRDIMDADNPFERRWFMKLAPVVVINPTRYSAKT